MGFSFDFNNLGPIAGLVLAVWQHGQLRIMPIMLNTDTNKINNLRSPTDAGSRVTASALRDHSSGSRRHCLQWEPRRCGQAIFCKKQGRTLARGTISCNNPFMSRPLLIGPRGDNWQLEN